MRMLVIERAGEPDDVRQMVTITESGSLPSML